MRKILLALAGVIAVLAVLFATAFFLWPRPADTTEARVVAIEFEDGAMNFYLLGIPPPIVARWLEADELVWTYPMIEGRSA